MNDFHEQYYRYSSYTAAVKIFKLMCVYVTIHCSLVVLLVSCLLLLKDCVIGRQTLCGWVTTT